MSSTSSRRLVVVCRSKVVARATWKLPQAVRPMRTCSCMLRMSTPTVHALGRHGASAAEQPTNHVVGDRIQRWSRRQRSCARTCSRMSKSSTSSLRAGRLVTTSALGSTVIGMAIGTAIGTVTDMGATLARTRDTVTRTKEVTTHLHRAVVVLHRPLQRHREPPQPVTMLLSMLSTMDPIRTPLTVGMQHTYSTISSTTAPRRLSSSRALPRLQALQAPRRRRRPQVKPLLHRRRRPALLRHHLPLRVAVAITLYDFWPTLHFLTLYLLMQY